MFAPLRIAIAVSATLLPASAAFAMSQPPQGTPGHGDPHGGSGSPTSPAPVPEPGVLGLFAAGLAGAYVARRMKKRRKD